MKNPTSSATTRGAEEAGKSRDLRPYSAPSIESFSENDLLVELGPAQGYGRTGGGIPVADDSDSSD